jgi:NodT family efflux transporter outer membrane factor (OMF) lipoprotein
MMIPAVVGAALVAALPLAAGAQQEAGVRTRSAEPLAFWEAVGDTTLVRLVRQTLAANGDLRAAAARVEQARAHRTEAALDLAPVVTASAGYTRERLSLAGMPGPVDRDRDYWDAGIQGSWEIDLFGRLRGGLRGRNALLGSSEADERDVQVIVTAELARGYVELRGLQEQLTVARENAANQERTFELTRRRLEAGRGNELDTERARAQLSQTRAAAVDLEARVTSAGYRIAVLAGREPETVLAELSPLQPIPPLPEFAAPVPGLLDAVVRRRPDVLSAERRVAAAAAFHGAANADYLPRLAIVGGLGTSTNEFDQIGGTGTSRYAVGPVVSWPLLNLGRVKAGADAARAQRDAAQAEYEQTMRRASEEIRTSVVRYDAARSRLALLEEAAQASRRAAELALRRFEGGAADFLQVLDADRTRLAAEEQLARGRAEAAALLVGLYHAFGAEWPGDR